MSAAGFQAMLSAQRSHQIYMGDFVQNQTHVVQHMGPVVTAIERLVLTIMMLLLISTNFG